MSNDKLQVLYPTGRLVQGSLTEMQNTDADNKPLKVKSGPNEGQLYERSFFALAIKKVPGHTHWNQTEWGAQLWNEAIKCWPKGHSGSPSFAFKVEDGDSTIPNTKNKRNCDRPGFPGCWIVNFGSSYPVRVVNSNGQVALTEVQAKAIKPGHFIQVLGDYVSNTSDLKPGMYSNHIAVSYQGLGEEIHFGVDTSQVGFGTGAKPEGLSDVPVGGASAAQLAQHAPLPAAPAPAIPQPAAAAPLAAAAPTAVKPAAPFVQPQMAPPPPAGAPAPPAPAADPVTTTGIAYASYISQGWTVAQLKAQGIIT